MQVSVRNKTRGALITINVDYCHLPIRCKYCLLTEHVVRNCTWLLGLIDRSREINLEAAMPIDLSASLTSNPSADTRN